MPQHLILWQKVTQRGDIGGDVDKLGRRRRMQKIKGKTANKQKNQKRRKSGFQERLEKMAKEQEKKMRR